MTLGITHLHVFFGETLNCSSILEALDDMLPRMQPPGAPVFCFCRGVYASISRLWSKSGATNRG